MGVEVSHALSSVRISFGLTNNEAEVREAAHILSRTAQHLKINATAIP
jgi:cysteine sulfinate desulfinase/cysteine desulfurase-like protein